MGGRKGEREKKAVEGGGGYVCCYQRPLGLQ